VVSSALMPPETAIRRMTPKREPMYWGNLIMERFNKTWFSKTELMSRKWNKIMLGTWETQRGDLQSLIRSIQLMSPDTNRQRINYRKIRLTSRTRNLYHCKSRQKTKATTLTAITT
jgi:hypothetical protein